MPAMTARTRFESTTVNSAMATTTVTTTMARPMRTLRGSICCSDMA